MLLIIMEVLDQAKTCAQQRFRGRPLAAAQGAMLVPETRVYCTQFNNAYFYRWFNGLQHPDAPPAKKTSG
jgi:hypothetical protein